MVSGRLPKLPMYLYEIEIFINYYLRNYYISRFYEIDWDSLGHMATMYIEIIVLVL